MPDDARPPPGDRAGATHAVERAWRDHWARLVAIVVAQLGRPDLAEDAVAEAFESAARRWPEDGVPTNPAAWLLTAARRRAVDRLRHEAVHARRAPLMAVDARTREEASAVPDDDDAIPDERLALVLACCHPAIAPEARVALTLRFVVGLRVDEIARLLLVQEATMAARITRAKQRLARSGIPFTVPPPDRLPERLDVVASVLHLLFTAGYQPAEGERPLRVDLADEAVRLTRLLDRLVPGQPVLRALLALLLLQHSRRDARVDAQGRLVMLPEQDRSLWHHDEVAEALDFLSRVPAGAGAQAERYRLEALAAAEHATAAAPADTRWDVVATRYAELEALTGSPVVRLARAVAVAEHAGPQAGLALLDGLDERLPRSHRLPAVRGELLARAGRTAEALSDLREAARRAPDSAERAHLERRITEVRAVGSH